jgi:spore protease
LFERLGCCKVSAISPGVLGQTGIETLDIVKGAVSSVHPDLIIAIDALAARSCERLGATVQISDSGISPGSGIGNRRSAISFDTVGVPVMALGVPTVVDSATLVREVLLLSGYKNISADIDKILNSGRSFFVSPKECDAMIKCICKLFSTSIGRAFGIPEIEYA